MEKICLTIIAILAVSFGYAQQAPATKVESQIPAKISNAQKADQIVAEYQQKIALTDAQKQKLKQVELERLNKLEEWQKKDQEENKALMDARKVKMDERQAFNKSNRESFDQIFTPDQSKKLAELAEVKRKEDMAKRAAEMEKWKEEINKKREAMGQKPATQTVSPVTPLKKG